MQTTLSILLSRLNLLKARRISVPTFSGWSLQGKRTFQGLQISIENKKGSVRQWEDNQGHKGSTKMKYDYGYINRTQGKDGDHIDVYVGPNENSPFVYVIHQNDPKSGKYDEDKVMLGFGNALEAKKAYLEHYDDIKFFGGIKKIAFDQFKEKALKTLHNSNKSLKAQICIKNNQLILKARTRKYLRRWRGADGKYRYLYADAFLNPFKALLSIFSLSKPKIENKYKELKVQEKYEISQKVFASHLLEYFTNKSKWDKLFKENKKEVLGLTTKKGVQEKFQSKINKPKDTLINIKTKMSFNKSLMRDIYNLFNVKMEDSNEQQQRDQQSIAISGDNDRESPGTGKIKTARESLTRKPTKQFLSENFRAILKSHQADFINLSLENFIDHKEKSVFNMDGTGAGKTLQEIGLAQTYLEKKDSTKPVLIVTENKRIINSSFFPDAQMVKVDISHVENNDDIKGNNVYITTYNRLKEFENKKFGLVIFDESHNLKNKSQQTERGEKLIDNADNVGLFSATPLDKGNQIGYITKAFQLSKTKVMRALGYELADQWTGRHTIKVWKASKSAEEIANRIDAFFTSLTEKGLAVKKEVPLENLETKITNIELTEEQQQQYAKAESSFIQTIKRNPKAKATALMALRRFTEELKLDATTNNIMSELKADKKKQLVLFATRVNDSDVFGEESLGTLKELSKRLQEQGIEHVNVFASNKKAKDDIQKFQEGSVRVILTTPTSGGTGISLDDTEGDRPRKAIVMTPPFSAMDFIQNAGRINRMNTKSKAEIEMYSTDTMVDGWNKDIIANKLLTLGSAVSGDYKKLDIKELDRLQYMSNEDQRQYMEEKKIDQKIAYTEDRKMNIEDFKLESNNAVNTVGDSQKFPKNPLRNIDAYKTFIPTNIEEEWPNAKIGFGKYRSKTLSDVQERDPGYLRWMLSNISQRFAGMVGNIKFSTAEVQKAYKKCSKLLKSKIIYRNNKIFLKAGVSEGTVVYTPNIRGRVPAIIAEIRGRNAVVIEKNEDRLPELHYYPLDNLEPIANALEYPECLTRFYDYYTTISSYKQPYMQKASVEKSNLIPKRVTIKGKKGTYTAIRYVKVKAPKVATSRKKTVTEKDLSIPKQRLVQQWKEHLTPTVDEYQGLISGNRESLGKYVMRALWKKGVGEVESVNQTSITDVVNDIATRITGVRPEGFQPSDIMQEVAIRLMEMQDQGRFASNQVPRDKFASFLANTVRNTSLEILRKQNLDKFAEKDINDFADQIADVRTDPVDEKMETIENNERIVEAIKEGYTQLPLNQKVALDNVLGGKSHAQIVKELRVTPDALKSLVKRAYNSIAKNMQQQGLPVVSGGRGITKEIKSILMRETGALPTLSRVFRARINILPNGNLMLKAKRYEVGEISPATGKKKVAPGKWENVPRGTTPEGKGSEKKPKPKPDEKPKSVTGADGADKEAMKKTFKNAIKGFIETLTDVFSGKGGGETAAQEIQRGGEDIRRIKASRTQQKSKEGNKE